MRLQALRHRTECLNSAITGLAKIVGNRQAYKEQQLGVQEAKRSIREAKSTKAITLLGLFFIPLAYTSSLFSLTDSFAPGGLYFWVYWAASFPPSCSSFSDTMSSTGAIPTTVPPGCP